MNKKLLIKLFLNFLSLLIVSYLIPGFIFKSLMAAIVTAIIFGAVNTFIKPILQIIFLPVTLVTFGVAAFLINVVLLWGISFIVPGFDIINFTTAVFASLILMLVSMFLNKLAEDKKQV